MIQNGMSVEAKLQGGKTEDLAGWDMPYSTSNKIFTPTTFHSQE